MIKSPKKLLAGAGALAAIGLGGAAIADAATTSSSSTTTTTSAPGYGARPGFPAPGSAAHEGAEKAVTGAAAAKAQAAAVKSVGSGTAGAVTTDFSGHGYEVTVTKSDGTKAEVHLDSSFNVCPGPCRRLSRAARAATGSAAGRGRERERAGSGPGRVRVGRWDTARRQRRSARRHGTPPTRHHAPPRPTCRGGGCGRQGLPGHH